MSLASPYSVESEATKRIRVLRLLLPFKMYAMVIIILITVLLPSLLPLSARIAKSAINISQRHQQRLHSFHYVLLRGIDIIMVLIVSVLADCGTREFQNLVSAHHCLPNIARVWKLAEKQFWRKVQSQSFRSAAFSSWIACWRTRERLMMTIERIKKDRYPDPY